AKATQVDDFDADVLLGEPFSHLVGGHRHPGVSDEGDVAALSGDGGTADRGDVVVLRFGVIVGDLALGVVQTQVLHEQDRVVVADGGSQHGRGFGRGAGGHHLETGDEGVEQFDVLRVGRTELLSATTGGTDDHGHTG